MYVARSTHAVFFFTFSEKVNLITYPTSPTQSAKDYVSSKIIRDKLNYKAVDRTWLDVYFTGRPLKSPLSVTHPSPPRKVRKCKVSRWTWIHIRNRLSDIDLVILAGCYVALPTTTNQYHVYRIPQFFSQFKEIL